MSDTTLNFMRQLEDDKTPTEMPRDEEHAAVAAFLDGRTPEDGPRGMGWWGITGRGKTHFRRGIERDLDERMKDDGLAYASVSAAFGDPIDQVLSVRAQLARRSKMRFLLFDWAFVRYFQIVYPDADIRQRHSNLFTRPKDSGSGAPEDGQAADEIVSWLMDLGKDVAGASLEAGLSMVPSFKALQASLKSGAGRILQRVERAKIRDQINLLETLSVEELKSSLPHYLAFDIALERELGKCPDQIVVMVDDADLIPRERVVHLPDHSWLEALMANCPKTDFVLFTRKSLDCSNTGVKIDWRELPAFPEETIDEYLKSTDINPFSEITSKKAYGEPLLAKLFAENGTLPDGCRQDELDETYRAYVEAVLHATPIADRHRAYLISIFDGVDKAQYMHFASKVIGPAEVMQWEHVVDLPFVVSNGQIVDVVEPLKTALKNTLLLLDSDVLKPLRAHLLDNIMSETHRTLSSERFGHLVDLIEATDWNDPEAVPTLDAVFKRFLRYTHEGTLVDIMDLVKREAARLRVEPGAKSRVAAMILRWKWEVACRRGEYDIAQDYAAQFYEHMASHKPLPEQEIIEAFEMGLEAHVMACTIYYASAQRISSIKKIASNMETHFWGQVQARIKPLQGALQQNHPAVVNLEKNTENAISKAWEIVDTCQLSELPALIGHLQHIAVEADSAISFADNNYFAMDEVVMDVESVLGLLAEFARIFARIGRLFCTLAALRDQGFGYLRLGSTMAYGLSVDLGSMEKKALVLLGEDNDSSSLSFRERMDEIEFEAECATHFPDGRRLGRLGAAIMESCMRRKQYQRAINTGARFDRVTGEPFIMPDEVDTTRVYAHWANALYQEERVEEARRVYDVAKRLAQAGTRYLAEGDIRTGLFNQAQTVLRLWTH